MVGRTANKMSSVHKIDIGRPITTHKIACAQVTPKRLFTAALMLKMREMNQKALTAFARELAWLR